MDKQKNYTVSKLLHLICKIGKVDFMDRIASLINAP